MPADRTANGWLVIDKPQGLTSSRVVDRVRRATGAKVGHAGTLDPLATGVLPIALGEATKTIAYAMMAQKRYRFRVRWGIARATDDCEGEIVGESEGRPGWQAIEAILPRFAGTILQTPPVYSAVKVAGRRSYALARAGRPRPLSARPVEIFSLRLIATPSPDHADFDATVGKGTYIRALVRDLAAGLGTLGHVADLRRLSVGPFTEREAISLESVSNAQQISRDGASLLPIEAALTGIPTVTLTAAEAERLRCGQRVVWCNPVPPGQSDRTDAGAVVGAWHDDALVALARVEGGSLRPLRVINLPNR
jgi:tRNA pseudouridine55 synthase